MEYKPPFSINDDIINLLAKTSELVGQVSILHKSSGFDESKLPLQSAMKKCPEIALIHAADLIATHIIESEVTDD